MALLCKFGGNKFTFSSHLAVERSCAKKTQHVSSLRHADPATTDRISAYGLLITLEFTMIQIARVQDRSQAIAMEVGNACELCYQTSSDS